MPLTDFANEVTEDDPENDAGLSRYNFGMTSSLGVWIIQPIRQETKVPAGYGLQLINDCGFVDGGNPSANFNRNLFKKIYGRSPTKGEIGCALAHAAAYEYLSSSELDHLLVLEDDAEQIRMIENWQDLICDIPEGRWILLLQSRMIPGKGTQDKYPNEKIETLAEFGTTAYIISRPAARQIKLDQERRGEIFWQADWPPLSANKIQFYRLSANVFSHGSRKSSIGRPAGGTVDRRRFIRRVISTFRAPEFSFSEKILIFRKIHLREIRLFLGK